jgi:MFS family permease
MIDHPIIRLLRKEADCKKGDMYGHKRIYSFGLLAFALFAALTAGIDENFIAFCVLRALKGVAAACTIPTAYAIVANTYEGKARELAVAGLGAATTLGAIGGTISKTIHS